MKHSTKHSHEVDELHMLSLMRKFPLASIILAEAHKDIVFHLPLIYCNGKLIGILKKTSSKC